METNKEINNIFEDTDKLEELLAVDNVEAVTPDDNDIISVGEESVIEECLNDTDGSLSSVNLDFFNDPPKPIKGRRKKTMEKRKEERMSFRHVVDEATGSDNEDDEDFSSMSSISSVESNFLTPVVLERNQLKDTMPSTSKKSDSTNTVKKKNILDILKEMRRNYNMFKNNFSTFCPSEEDNLCNLKKTLRTPKSDKERKSKPDEFNVEMLEQKRNRSKIDDVISKMEGTRGKKRLLRSKSVEELRRNYEEGKSEYEEEITEALKREVSNMDIKIPSSNKNRNISKRVLLSPKSGENKKSEPGKEFQNIEIVNEAIDDVETPSTSKNANVPKMRVGGLKRIPLPESDEEEEEWNNDDLVPRSSKNLYVAKKKVVRRKRKVSAKREEAANNAHIYSFFSSMADLVSTLPYSTTLTAKARVTKMLEEMVERLEKWNSDRSPLKPIEGHEISEEDLKLIKLRLSRLPYVY